ncbi:FAD/NAD(P)-binding protein [Desemzia incerta]|uniref:FAD/NAD(P)-binding protein n=1 Tax=Desemzia incerta TaxID=82801 RepID=UPI0024C41005|nr:FAD/NAD(P)-binding protein [Desemzia incerta]WHZ31272.1 FAD/NAD(P)-binding protein [Desemzia incerta]
MRKIAIIGAGVAGISVLNALLKNAYYADCEIVIYDQQKTFGTGLPYQPDSKELLINQTADTMSLIPEDPLDFVKWLEREKGVADGAKKHFSRTWYGEYLKEQLKKAVKAIEPTIIHEYVLNVRVEKNGEYTVETIVGSATYDIVHLCTGHLPYQDPYQLMGENKYYYHPYPLQETLSAIPPKARVGIIGTGLTSIDIMRFLTSQNKEYKIQFFSRTGNFSLYRELESEITLHYLTMENLNRAKKEHNGSVPLEMIKEWFYLECLSNEVNVKELQVLYGKGTKEQLKKQLINKNPLSKLQTIIYKFDPCLPDFLQALTVEDKKAFFSFYEPLFNHFRTPMPKESLRSLLALWDSGKVDVATGLQNVEVTDSGFDMILAHEKGMHVEYLINATGHDFSMEPSLYQTELINQLIDQQLVQSSEFGGIQVTWPNAEVISPKYGQLKGLYAHGQLIKGTQYVNSARAIMLRAYQVVDEAAKEWAQKNVQTD